MFVVHTVNQLEEAVRVGAEEILVTGGLASNVHEAYLLKSCKDDVPAMAESVQNHQQDSNVDHVAQRAGVVSGWGTASLMIITGEYSLLDSQLDSRPPSMILQRTSQLSN